MNEEIIIWLKNSIEFLKSVFTFNAYDRWFYIKDVNNDVIKHKFEVQGVCPKCGEWGVIQDSVGYFLDLFYGRAWGFCTKCKYEWKR